MYTPVNPSFTIKKWGLRGSNLYGHVFVMACLQNSAQLAGHDLQGVIGILIRAIKLTVPNSSALGNILS